MSKIDRSICEYTEVAALTGLTWDQLLQREAAGTFPARINEVSRQLWNRTDVEAWLREHRQ